MDRMEEKHAREVKLALEKDRIERDGDLRSQTRIARQTSAQLQKVKGEHIVLTEELDSVVKKNNYNFLFACFPFADSTSFISFPS